MRGLQVQHGLYVGRSRWSWGGVGGGRLCKKRIRAWAKAVRAALCHQSRFLLPTCLSRSELLELSQYVMLGCFWDFVIFAYRLQNGGHSLGLLVVISLVSCELPDLTPHG